MKITLVQQGVITQNEFAKLAMLTSDGRIEIDPPKSDDEGRDFELHLRGRFGRIISIQAKTTLQLHKQKEGRARLGVSMSYTKHRPRASRSLYYFLAWFDPTIMRFRDPVFLVPSLVLHRRLKLRNTGGYWHLTRFTASLDLRSQDMWAGYQVDQKDLGRVLVKLMR